MPDLAALAATVPDCFVTVADNVVAPKLAAAGVRAIVQNAGQKFDGAVVLPMFPQNGVSPRDDAARGDAIRRVIFVGCRGQLHPDLLAPDFSRKLAAMGVAFDVVDKSRAARRDRVRRHFNASRTAVFPGF